MIAVQGMQKPFHIFPFGMTVCGAGIFCDWKMIFILKSDDVGFVHEHERTDDSQIHAVQIGSWRKAVKTAFEDQRKQHGFHNVVLMMGIGNFVAAKLLQLSVQGALTQLGAEGTGIVLLTLLKYNLGNLGFHNGVGNLQFLTEGGNGRQIETWIAKIYSDGLQLEVLRIKTAKIAEGIQQGQTVLSSGNANGNLISFFDHLIFINSLSGQAEQAL